MSTRPSAVGRQTRAARRIAVAFTLTIVSALSLAGVYVAGGQPQAEGVLLALALAGMGTGLVMWAAYLRPAETVIGPREPLESTEAERTRFEETFAAGEAELLGDELVARRRFLVRLLWGAAGALGVAALFPIRSLGPSPGRSLTRTAWHTGSRLVKENGEPVRVDDLEVGGVLTVFPEGHLDSASAQTLLIRVPQRRFRPRPGRDGWAPDGYVAYSKICTHAGCPVGLYRTSDHQLLCPCHQSTFDVLDGARPVFGPATRSLPQLPLAIDADGYLVARSDYHEPVGPGFWNRS